MELLIATHNEAKFNRYKNLLADIPGLSMQSLSGANIHQKIEEPYSTSIENAIHKAKEYARLAMKTTLAIDESVRTNFLPNDEQPGVFVRRMNKGHELTDQAVLAFWKETFKKYPHKDRRFIWEFGIACCSPSEVLSSTIVKREDRVSENFSDVVVKGYPMDSFLIQPGLDRPASECAQEEKTAADKKVFSEFVAEFRQWLKKGE